MWLFWVTAFFLQGTGKCYKPKGLLSDLEYNPVAVLLYMQPSLQIGYPHKWQTIHTSGEDFITVYGLPKPTGNKVLMAFSTLLVSKPPSPYTCGLGFSLSRG